MSIHPCTKCGLLRAKKGEKLCPVCWLVAELAREHAAGEHMSPNASCRGCMRPIWKSQTRVDAETRRTAKPYAEPRSLYPGPQRGVVTPEPMVVEDLSGVWQGMIEDAAVKIRTNDAVDRVEKRRARSGAHANCDHPATKAARAKCRAERMRRA